MFSVVILCVFSVVIVFVFSVFCLGNLCSLGIIYYILNHWCSKDNDLYSFLQTLNLNILVFLKGHVGVFSKSKNQSRVFKGTTYFFLLIS